MSSIKSSRFIYFQLRVILFSFSVQVKFIANINLTIDMAAKHDTGHVIMLQFYEESSSKTDKTSKFYEADEKTGKTSKFNEDDQKSLKTLKSKENEDHKSRKTSKSKEDDDKKIRNISKSCENDDQKIRKTSKVCKEDDQKTGKTSKSNEDDVKKSRKTLKTYEDDDHKSDKTSKFCEDQILKTSSKNSTRSTENKNEKVKATEKPDDKSVKKASKKKSENRIFFKIIEHEKDLCDGNSVSEKIWTDETGRMNLAIIDLTDIKPEHKNHVERKQEPETFKRGHFVRRLLKRSKKTQTDHTEELLAETNNNQEQE